VAPEVEPHAGLELLFAEQRVLHAHHFRALLVHRHGVEVADLHVGLRPDRVLHRPRVLRELGRAQRARFLDAGYRARVGVGAVFLVAEHRQAFLQRKLEPVPASDAIAGPVVEVLVGDDAVDVDVVGVGRGVGARQHVLGVEDVEALVLHRAGVEVAHRHDLVLVEVQLEAEALLVPRDRALQAVHRPAGLVEFSRFDVHEEVFILVFVFQDLEVGGNQSKKIGRLRERVDEARPVPLALPSRKRRGCRSRAGPGISRGRRAPSWCSAPSRRAGR
jgi:hypothetical protein